MPLWGQMGLCSLDGSAWPVAAAEKLHGGFSGCQIQALAGVGSAFALRADEVAGGGVEDFEFGGHAAFGAGCGRARGYGFAFEHASRSVHYLVRAKHKLIQVVTAHRSKRLVAVSRSRRITFGSPFARASNSLALSRSRRLPPTKRRLSRKQPSTLRVVSSLPEQSSAWRNSMPEQSSRSSGFLAS